jgi:hypothetical protein
MVYPDFFLWSWNKIKYYTGTPYMTYTYHLVVKHGGYYTARAGNKNALLKIIKPLHFILVIANSIKMIWLLCIYWISRNLN